MWTKLLSMEKWTFFGGTALSGGIENAGVGHVVAEGAMAAAHEGVAKLTPEHRMRIKLVLYYQPVPFEHPISRRCLKS